jgi:hypothetical protein
MPQNVPASPEFNQTLFVDATTPKLTKYFINLTDCHALLVIFRVDDGRLELSSWNLAVEQDIALTVGAMLELREEEESHAKADAGSTPPDVTTLSCQVPPCWVEHLRGEIDHWDLSDIVGGTTDTGTQGAKANG